AYAEEAVFSHEALRPAVVQLARRRSDSVSWSGACEKATPGEVGTTGCRRGRPDGEGCPGESGRRRGARPARQAQTQRRREEAAGALTIPPGSRSSGARLAASIVRVPTSGAVFAPAAPR